MKLMLFHQKHMKVTESERAEFLLLFGKLNDLSLRRMKTTIKVPSYYRGRKALRIQNA